MSLISPYGQERHKNLPEDEKESWLNLEKVIIE